jgi:hypothetical protein
MEHEILAKLQKLLSNPLERESEVVYLFVEIRKFLDHKFPVRADEKVQFPVLRMFCDWVAHTELKGYGKNSILEALDNALMASANSPKAQKTAFDILALKPLQAELQNFFNAHGLPIDITDDYGQWGNLLKLYLGVVSECPLVFRADGSNKHLASATPILLQLPDMPDAKNTLYIASQWRLELKDGTTALRSFGYTISKT